eukprot:362070-Chlamydomonas_euryale.AAC.11
MPLKRAHTKRASQACPHQTCLSSVPTHNALHSLEPWLRHTPHLCGLVLLRGAQDLARAGAAWGVCPYYGTRQLVADADLLMLPYASVLSEEASGRECSVSRQGVRWAVGGCGGAQWEGVLGEQARCVCWRREEMNKKRLTGIRPYPVPTVYCQGLISNQTCVIYLP